MKSRRSVMRLGCILSLFFLAITSAWAVPSPIIALDPPLMPGGDLDKSYSLAITGSGGAAPYTFAVTGGSLPAGLTLTSNGLLSGIFAPGAPFTITATDTNSNTGSALYTPLTNSGSYNIYTLAGQASSMGSADGTNNTARFDFPEGIARDLAGNLFVVDTFNNTVRKLSPAGTNWVVTTLAGLAGSSGSADGTNSTARFLQPGGITVDSVGNLYVTDTGNTTVRQITPSGTNWVVTTIAGLAGNTGNADGTNGAASFFTPVGITVDGAGNLYVADQNSHTIRKITPAGTNWVVTTIGGQSGNTGSADGTNQSSRFYRPTGIAADNAGNVYVADNLNSNIRKMTPAGTDWVTTTIAGLALNSGSTDGTNTVARFSAPYGIAVDSDTNLYVTESRLLRKITPSGTDWITTTIAGSAISTGSADGFGSAARFNGPEGIVADSAHSIYFADQANHTIRKGNPAALVTVILSNLVQTYDGAGKTATATTSPVNVPVNVSYSAGKTPTNAGNYTFTATVSLATFFAGSTNGTLTVNPIPVTITFSNLVQTYDGTAKSATALPIPTNAPVVVAYLYPSPTNLNFNPPTNAGTYAVLSGTTDNNYNSGIVSNVFTINPAIPAILVSNLFQSYDGTPKSVSVATVPAGLTVNVTYNGSSIAPSNTGSYTVVASVVNSNYVGSVTNTLIIAGVVSPATVVLSNLTQAYDGTAKSVIVTTAPPGLSTSVTYNGSPNAPTNAGSYTVIAMVTDPGYNGGATNTLLITSPVAFTSTNSATFSFALSNSFAVTAAGYPVPALSIISTLPTGVAFTDNGNGSGTLSGVPTPAYGKFFPLSFVASNSLAGGVVTQSFQLTLDFVPYHPAITSSVSFTTPKNRPLTLSEPYLLSFVTTNRNSRVTAVDPTSFQGYGRILWTNGAATYVPATDYTGQDFYEYTVTNSGGSLAEKVSFTVFEWPAQDPQAVSVTPNPEGYFVVFASSNAGDIFNVEYRGTLEPGDTWLPLSNGLHTDLQPGMQTPGLILLEDTNSPSPAQRFYRVKDAGPE